MPLTRQRTTPVQRAGAWMIPLFTALTVLPMTARVEAAAPSRVACGACEQPDRFVRVQESPPERRSNRASDTAPLVRFSPEDWAAVLQHIHIRKRNHGWRFLAASQDAATPAFTREEIDYLSATLPRAFAHAQPDEWVIFGLSRTATPDMAELTEFTTGAWYVDGDALHLVLANYREGVTMPGIRDLLQKDPLHMLAGPQYEFSSGPHQHARPEDGGLRAFLFPDPPELVLAYHALMGEAHQAGEPPSGSGSVHLPLPSPSAQPPLEEQLHRLKRLKEQGLISDEDYQLKKRRILERF